MKFWQKHKWKIIVPVLIVLALAAAFTLGDRDMPKQKDTSEQPTVAAPVETPEQDTAAADVPDDVETGPVETPAESTPEPSDAPQTDKPARADTEPPEYLSPEEIQASATGEYEEVGGMMIDTGTGKDKYQTDPVPEGKPIPVEPEDVEIGDGRITGREFTPEHPGGIDFCMYHADQYAQPKGDYSKVFSADDAAWYKQYAADTVERKPYQTEDGKIAYHEKIVQKLPNPPQRKDRM